jgi:hypothetical protein
MGRHKTPSSTNGSTGLILGGAIAANRRNEDNIRVHQVLTPQSRQAGLRFR